MKKFTFLLSFILCALFLNAQERITVFEETCGEVTSNTNVSSYSGWDNGLPITFTTTEGNPSVRNATGTTHVWFPAGTDTDLIISNIDASGYEKLKLSFDVTSNTSAVNVNKVIVYYNEQQLAIPNVDIPVRNEWVNSGEIDLSDAETIKLRFLYTAENNPANHGYRLTNFKITGTPVGEETLDAPVVAEATEVTSNSFKANWTVVEGAEGYKVRVYTKEEDVETEIDNSPFTVVENNFLVIEGLESETQYFYTVTAFADGGELESEPSGEMDVTTLAEIPTELATPEVSAATEVTHNSFQANWSEVAGAEGYYVKVYTKEGDEETEIANSPFEVVGENFRIIEGLDSETEYFYTVVAFNTDADLESGESTEMNVTTLTEPNPSAPTIMVLGADEGILTFFLEPNTGETYQMIQVSGENLTGDITLTFEGDDTAKEMFKAAPNVIKKEDAAGDGLVVSIIYAPKAHGTYEVTLVITTDGLEEDKEIKLIGRTQLDSPSITVEDEDGTVEGPIDFFAVNSIDGDTKYITVSGSNLTGDKITLELQGDDLDKGMFTLLPTELVVEEGTVNEETVAITYSPTAKGTHTVTLVISTAGADAVEIELIGTSELEVPVATPATLVLADGFTANWNALEDATQYELHVYTKEPTSGEGTELVVNGDFENWEDNLPANWNFSSVGYTASQETTIVNETTTSLKVDRSAASTGTLQISQAISNLTPGTTYTLSMDYYIESGDGTDLRIWCNFMNNAGKDFGDNDLVATGQYSKMRGPGNESSTDPNYFADERGEWKTYTTQVTLPDTAAGFNFQVRVYSTAVVYLANFSLVETDEVLTPVTGSPFTGITATSYKVEGLQEETEYFYAVKAIVSKNNRFFETELSNEISVTTISPVPTITVKETSVPNMTAVVGATDTKTIHVSGVYLEGDITLALEGTNAGMFSLSKTTLVEEDGVVAEEAIVITYEPNAAGSHTATLRITSEDATEVTFTLNGTATEQGGTNLPEYADNFIIYSANGQVHFETVGGLAVEVYNTVGQPIYRGVSVEGLNSIPADGVIIIRVGNTVNKVIVK